MPTTMTKVRKRHAIAGRGRSRRLSTNAASNGAKVIVIIVHSLQTNSRKAIKALNNLHRLPDYVQRPYL